jgi:hypothetical protein
MLWDQYCLIEVCLAWGGRSIVLETVAALLPTDVMVRFLADRGFEHGELMRWLDRAGWDWAIRAKSDLVVTLNNGIAQPVSALLPPAGQAYLYHNVQIIGDIDCHLRLWVVY